MPDYQTINKMMMKMKTVCSTENTFQNSQHLTGKHLNYFLMSQIDYSVLEWKGITVGLFGVEMEIKVVIKGL